MTTPHLTSQREVNFAFHDGFLILAPDAHLAFLNDVKQTVKKGIEHEKDRVLSQNPAAKHVYEKISGGFHDVVNHVVDDLVFGFLEDKAPGLANAARVKVGTRAEFMAMPTEQQDKHINTALRGGLTQLMRASKVAIEAVNHPEIPESLFKAMKLAFSLLEAVVEKMQLAVMRPDQDAEPKPEPIVIGESELPPDAELVFSDTREIAIRFNGTHAFLSADTYLGHFQSLAPVLRQKIYESKAQFAAITGKNADCANGFVDFMLDDVLFGELSRKSEIISRCVAIKIDSAEAWQAASNAEQSEMISQAIQASTRQLVKLSREGLDYAAKDDEDMKELASLGFLLIEKSLARIKYSSTTAPNPNAPQH